MADSLYQKVENLFKYYSEFLQGKDKAVKLVLLSFFSKGHILIEDNPGLGKTTLALAIANSMGLNFGRVQCTNDLLPGDITGLNIFNREKNSFEFIKGPIFNNIVLVDEINRATPKTQSALLEAMGEKQVTIEGKTYPMLKPFFVIATQNPSEQYGTFPLPESQLDRFLMKISIGYPQRSEEINILKGGSSRGKILQSQSVINEKDVLDLITHIRNNIFVDDKILCYLMNIVEKTRNNSEILIGLSTRAALSIINVAKVSAFFSKRNYVVPEDILNYYEFTMPHRIVFKGKIADGEKREIITTIIRDTKLPYD